MHRCPPTHTHWEEQVHARRPQQKSSCTHKCVPQHPRTTPRTCLCALPRQPCITPAGRWRCCRAWASCPPRMTSLPKCGPSAGTSWLSSWVTPPSSTPWMRCPTASSPLVRARTCVCLHGYHVCAPHLHLGRAAQQPHRHQCMHTCVCIMCVCASSTPWTHCPMASLPQVHAHMCVLCGCPSSTPWMRCPTTSSPPVHARMLVYHVRVPHLCRARTAQQPHRHRCVHVCACVRVCTMCVRV